MNCVNICIIFLFFFITKPIYIMIYDIFLILFYFFNIFPLFFLIHVCLYIYSREYIYMYINSLYQNIKIYYNISIQKINYLWCKMSLKYKYKYIYYNNNNN